MANGSKKQCTFAESAIPKDIDQVQSVDVVVDELEGKLAVGNIMRSVDDAYLLYCKYAHAKGFSVKKCDQRYFSHTNELQAKEFECSCEGVKDEKRSSQRLLIYQKPITRTKCKVKLRITREKGGEWKFLSWKMKCMDHNLGFIRKDAYDHLSRLKKHTKVENGDASALLQYFINKSNNEAFFYWNVQLDDDNRVINFFFRDYRCRVDYEYFGDVVSVDTTYRTNRYNLICAPFVGINHHRQNVMFGLAFMSDETESSFEWLFSTFLDSMSGKQPETIFSDQCQAMMNAIEKIFPCAHHRLCQWHINQNAPLHLGNLNGDSMFKHLWHKCMSHCESEEEFEATWKSMMDQYNLGSHKWLNGMYKLRHKWATAFSNQKFSAGLLATSRSEATNLVLKKAGNKSISLYDFVLIYEKIQTNWRAKEKAEDTRCRHGKPSMIVKNHPLLSHAADVYTLNIYQLFELELINSLNTIFDEQPLDFGSPSLEFKVKSHVFNYMNVSTLPKSYIKKRWMKNARDRVFDEAIEDKSGNGSTHTSEMVFVNQAMRSIYDLTMQAKAYEETRNVLVGIINSATQQINALVENLSLNDQNGCEKSIVDEEDGDEVLIRNPLYVKSRGLTNARIVRH
ncbi:hypothetical protein DH2020_008170 [Rehmannia glutinosa]|uniref:Protein FAR1-RELATED SEQUENCE n=1 Tax=Rehmannia glutinosa TaxID=99300 RepID=A0ABR0U139_REHGL